MAGEIDSGVFTELKNQLDVLIDKRAKKKTSMHIAEVTDVGADGVIWVQIPGNEMATPVVWSGVDTKIGDQVRVEISNGVAKVTENLTDPSAGIQVVIEGQEVFDEKLSRIERVVVADRVETTKLLAQKASIEELEAVEAEIQEASIAVAYIGELNAAEVTAADLITANAYAEKLTADKIYADDFQAYMGYITNLKAKYVDAFSITAAVETVEHLEADYARLDAANIGDASIRSAWIDQLLVQSGLIAHEGAIFTLDAIQVNADNITAGTINVDRLVVSGPNNEKYLVQIDEATGDPSYVKLDGDVIQDNTITADKIVAQSITAEKITTENIVGEGGWINLRNGTFSYGDIQANDGISWDGQHLSIRASDIIFNIVNPETDTPVSTNLSSVINDAMAAIDDNSAAAMQNSQAISMLQADTAEVQDAVLAANTSLQTLNNEVFGRMPSYFQMTETIIDGVTRPLLILGGGTEYDLRAELTNDQLAFAYYDVMTGEKTVPAYISTDGLMIQKAEVVGDLFFGGWVWQERGNGHMTLRKAR